MKKALVVGILVTSAAFAAASLAAAQAPAPAAHKPGQTMMMDAAQMQEMHKGMMAEMVKSGKMTPEQAKAMDEQMASMQKTMGEGGMMKDLGGTGTCPGMGNQKHQ